MSTTTQNATTSLKKATWLPQNNNQKLAEAIKQKLNCSNIVASIIANRITKFEDLDAFINPSLKNTLIDPYQFIDMEKAVKHLHKAILAKEKLAVFGDYDVDGATSSAVLKRYFNHLGLEVLVHIPDRIKEGYGPNIQAIQGLKEKGAQTLITVDCGAVSYAPLAMANQIGLKTIVLDHHLGAEKLPEAVAVVNPNRVDELTNHNYLAAVGVSFMLCVALNRYLREQDYFTNNNINEPNLINLLDLVALGSVCDVMPLIGMNRSFVAQGLKVMGNRQNQGLKALSDVAKVDSAPSVYHLGFIIGPRINAGGRVGQADLGSKLLSTHNSQEAGLYAEQLHAYNIKRQEIEKDAIAQAELQAEQQADKAVLVLSSENWHQGIIGIVAGRIKEKFLKPTAVISLDEDTGKASCRSLEGVDFGAAIANAKAEGLIIDGGGHSMAAGFSIKKDGITALQDYLCENLFKQIATNSGRTYKYDAELNLSALSLELFDDIQIAAPYGNGNAEPKFKLKAKIKFCQETKGGHIRITLTDSNIVNVYAIYFSPDAGKSNKPILESVGKEAEFIVGIKRSNWQGREKLDVIIEDIKLLN